MSTLTSEEIVLRIRRSSDGQFLPREGSDWTSDAALAWTTGDVGEAVARANAAQRAAAHSFFAEVEMVRS